MNALSFTILEARPAPAAAAPALVFRIRIGHEPRTPVHALALRVQVQIEAPRRRYSSQERARLYELFGREPEWSRNLRAITWTQASTVVPAFEGTTEVDLPVPCTYDLEVASAKYLHALREGDISLLFLFTGTAFAVRGGALAAEPVPWDRQATFRLPARTWHEAMDTFFPGGGWIRLQRDTLDRLQAFRGSQAVITWDEAIDVLLQGAPFKETV